MNEVLYVCEEAKKMIKRWIEWDKQQGGCNARNLLEDFEIMVLPTLLSKKAGINLDLVGEEGLELIRLINQTIAEIYEILNDYLEECE